MAGKGISEKELRSAIGDDKVARRLVRAIKKAREPHKWPASYYEAFLKERPKVRAQFDKWVQERDQPKVQVIDKHQDRIGY